MISNKVRTLKFNRRNMFKFANELYNEKTGEYTRMCNGYLTAPNKDSKTCDVIRCGLGELAWRFLGEHPGSKYARRDGNKNITVIMQEKEIARHFAEKPTVVNVKKAKTILNQIPDRNDCADTYAQRARVVADKIREFAKLIRK